MIPSTEATAVAYGRLDLNDMDELLLASAIHAAHPPREGRDRLDSAVGFAAYYHRNQTRASGQGQPRTRYMEHPLRVCLRLIRWGITDPTVLTAAVLHDVLEDCHEEIEVDYGRPASEVLHFVFGEAVGDVIDALTNPPALPSVPRAERNAQYIEHVAGSVHDPRVLLVKFSDFADNALSLHDHEHNDGMVRRLAAKYAPLVPIFHSALTDLIHESAEEEYVRAAKEMRVVLSENRLAELASNR